MLWLIFWMPLDESKLQSQWWFRWLLLCLRHLYCVHNPAASVLKRQIILDELIDVTHQNGLSNIRWWSPRQMNKAWDMIVFLSRQPGNWSQWRPSKCFCCCPFSTSVTCIHLDRQRVSCSFVHSYIYRRLIKIVYYMGISRIIEAVITCVPEIVVLQKRKAKCKLETQMTATSTLWLSCLKVHVGKQLLLLTTSHTIQDKVYSLLLT